VTIGNLTSYRLAKLIFTVVTLTLDIRLTYTAAGSVTAAGDTTQKFRTDCD